MAHNSLLYKRVLGTKILYFNSRHLFIQNRDSLVFCVVFSPWFSFGPFSFRHCFLYPSLVYGFWWRLWYLQLLPITDLITRPRVVFCRLLVVLLFFFFRPLFCLSFFSLQILITSLVSPTSLYNVFGIIIRPCLFLQCQSYCLCCWYVPRLQRQRQRHRLWWVNNKYVSQKYSAIL